MVAIYRLSEIEGIHFKKDEVQKVKLYSENLETFLMIQARLIIQVQRCVL